jgi:hypothetical protein
MEGTVVPNPESGRLFSRILLILIAVAAVLRCPLVFRLNIDGDEFRFLSLVYEYLRGQLGTPLMTSHVYLFQWLPAVSANEVDQIVAARVVMLALSLGSAVLTYLIGRSCLSRPGALFATLCYLTFSNVVVHGASFRFDPICSFFFLLSLYWLLSAPTRHVTRLLLSGTCLSVSLLVSLKSVFFVPTAAAVLAILVRFEHGKVGWRRWGWFGAGFVLISVPLFWLHSGRLARGAEDAPAAASRMARVALSQAGFFPQWRYLLSSVMENPLVWALLVLGLLMTARRVFPVRRAAKRDLLLLSFFLPLVSLSFYGYAYPYFVAAVISPGVVFCGVVFDRLYSRMGEHRRHAVWLLVFVEVVFGGFIVQYLGYSSDEISPQRRTLQVVHELFPEPVRYIDSCSMVSAYPQVGLYMTSWDLQNYFDRGEPIMRDLLRREHPAFLVADTYYLDLERPWHDTLNGGRLGLLAEDHAVLRDSFVRHWGAIYVPGKRVRFAAGEAEKDVELLIPGVYTLEGDGGVRIGGALVRPGQTVRLEGERITISPEKTPTTIVLRWGNHLRKPSVPPPDEPLFNGYYWRSQPLPAPEERRRARSH